jgi:hypothetical protein
VKIYADGFISLSERRSLMQGPLFLGVQLARNHTQLKIPETPIGAGAEGDSTILPL